MRYAAVATTGWLLLVELKTRQVQPLECNRPEYYGISWFLDSNDLVLSHSGLDNSKLIGIADYANSERGWLSAGRLSGKSFLSQPHQILCAPDGRVICANTGRNVISVYDLQEPSVFQEGSISSARWDRVALDQTTGDHLNSVFLRNNLLFVVAHGHTHGSKLATFCYPQLELISVEALGARTGLHNIWVTPDGQRISCHSENGCLIDVDDKTPLWESGAAIYLRGLAVTSDYILVGESQKTGRDLRRSSLSGLWILDRHTWRAIDYLCLGPYGAVNEVRILDEPDDAHHGHQFDGLNSLLGKDVRVDAFRQRIAAAESCLHAKHIWSAFESVFGSPEVTSDGAKRTGVDQLCLAVKQPPSGPNLAFSYTLDAQVGAHVSAVLDYRGGGGDRCMVALLLQPVATNAALSVWRHDGTEWTTLPGIGAHGLPQAGILRMATTDGYATLSIDGTEYFTLSATDLGLDRCNCGLGIRWIGASVLPIDEAKE